MSISEGNDLDERGWNAVTEAVSRHYPETHEFHVAYMPGLHFGSPLQGCSALRGDDHWFYVTYGLTELWAKESDEPTTSGYGYELTMRVRALPEEDAPPQWPYRALSNLADYVRHGPQELWLGDRIRLPDLAAGEPGSTLTTLAVTMDPVVAAIDTPNGRVEFWQAIGLTDDEVEAAKASSTDDVLQGMAISNPLLITDPARG
ncbi:suppressor of fused domain protein [Microbacterium sp. NPDC087665]|uniref:suppressor of fused domain protein n=1 Tax=Microbacterium sp. NPDC087665 TaxID=3364194 RepID=UPI0037F517BB